MTALLGNINKEVFLNAIVCPAYGWQLRRREAKLQLSLAERFRMEQGQEVHRRARALFESSITAGGPNFSASVERTAQLIKDPGVDVILEAAFKVGNYAAIADVLVRSSGGWELIEVKSKTSKDKKLVEDIAYTCMVLQRAGLEIARASAMIVSKDFRLDMTDDRLFETIDLTDEVQELAALFSKNWAHIDEVTGSDQQPDTQLTFECKNCPYCFERFIGSKTNHVFDLPRLSKKKFILLNDLGVEYVQDIPADFELTDNQQRVAAAVKLGQPLIGDDLADRLNKIQWPAAYLDFETFATAIPEFEDVGPWEQVGIQYSLHVCKTLGDSAEHFEYLCDHNGDERRQLVEQLIKDCKGLKSILVYTSFEKRILSSMKQSFPDLTSSLDGIIDRFVDLEEILRHSYYHPGFVGSTSIKKTLPVLVPEMTYKGMEIADGGAAMASFAFLRQGHFPNPEKVRQNLLEYCKQDTLAMVKIHERLSIEAKLGM